MLINLDFELYPKDCEVVHVPSHDLRIYLIQKNGSSSVRMEAAAQNWTIYRSSDIAEFSSIDVYIREPESRYLSGVNTFLQHLARDHPQLDPRTCEWFATRYLFLNRHYLPQWHWLVNLARVIKPDCVIRLHSVSDLRKITGHDSRARINPLEPEQRQRILDLSGNLDLWFLLDKILVGRCGQSFIWSELLDLYRQHPSRPLDVVTEELVSIAHVLR